MSHPYRIVRPILHTLAGLAIAAGAAARVGDMDPSFGSAGVLTIPEEYAAFPTALPGGGLQFYAVAGDLLKLYRTDADGQPDTVFGPGGKVAVSVPSGLGGVAAAAARANGAAIVGLYAGGRTTLLGVTSAGDLDFAFGEGGLHRFAATDVAGAAVAIIEQVVTATDGALYALVSYYASSVYDCARSVQVHRLTAQGQVDTDFGTQGAKSLAIPECREWGADGLSALAGGGFASGSAVFDIRGRPIAPLADVAATLGLMSNFVPTTDARFTYALTSSSKTGDVVTLVRLLPDLTRDMTFGYFGFGGTDLSYLPGGVADGSYVVPGTLLVPGAAGEYFYLAAFAAKASSTATQINYQPVIARLQSNGNQDFAFGLNGLVTLPASMGDPRPVLQKSDGSLVVNAQYQGRLLRLLGDARSGPGMVSVESVGLNARLTVREQDGIASIPVRRLLGSKGAASFRYRTRALEAMPGTDYTESSGILDWADGEEGVRNVLIPILKDAVSEPVESFEFILELVSGNSALWTDRIRVAIDENAVSQPQDANSTGSPPAPPGGATPSGAGSGAVSGAGSVTGGGGGGSFGIAALLFLATQVIARCRHPIQAVKRADKSAGEAGTPATGCAQTTVR
ncbi:MAG: Calx-beta domain-containing protein [Pseudomonadota bacterium]